MNLRAYTQAVMRDRPVLYAPCWEPGTVNRDLMGRNANAHDAGGAMTRYVQGPFGDKGVRFSAVDDGFIAWNDAAVVDLADVWSLECWIKHVAAGTYISKGANAYQIDFNGTTLRVLRCNVAVLCSATFSDTVKWHHFVGTKNGTVARLYLDGKDVTVAGANSTCTDTTNQLAFGCQPTTVDDGITEANAHFAHGALYNYALSRPQALAHYRAAWFR